MRYGDKNYLLCSLCKDSQWQVPLDLNFQEGTKIAFSSKGEGRIHLTGYLIMDEDADFEESLNPFDNTVEVEEKTDNKLSKRKAIGSPNGKQKSKRLKKFEDGNSSNDDDDSEEDESEDDSEDSEVDHLLDDDDDDDDDSDDSDEEEEDSEEDEEDEEEDKKDGDISKVQKQKNTMKLQQQEKMKKQIREQQQEKIKKQIQEQHQKKNKHKLINGEKIKQQEQQSNQQKKNKTEKQIGQPIVLKEGEKRVLKGGLIVEEKKLGKGGMVENRTQVILHISGHLKNGKSINMLPQGDTFKFTTGGKGVIQGFNIGVMGMKVGGKRRLVIPPNMAYV